MSRFSGLPDPLAKGPAKPGARFTNITEALVQAVRASPHSHANSSNERLRALALGEPYTGRLGTTKKTSSGATSAPRAAVRSAAAPAAATKPTVKKLGRTETVALAVRTDPKLKGMEDVALHMLDDPDMKGLSGDGVVRCLTGIDAGKYRAAMAEEERKASVARADAVWDRARASIDGSQPVAATDRKPAAGAKSGSADGIWSRAYAAAAR